MGLKEQAKKSAKSRSTGPKKIQNSDPDAEKSVSPINVPATDPYISDVPLPKFAYLRSFATIPALRDKGE
jgi:hypothetical protein